MFESASQILVAVDTPGNMTINFESNDVILPVLVHAWTTMESVLPFLARRLDRCEESLSPVYEGARVPSDERFIDIGMEDGDTVYLMGEQIGGKPVIYLYSPVDVEASVQLSLIPEWRFSAIYPVVPAVSNKRRGQQIEWNVRTHQDGCLTETNTGLKVSYLFWEAE